MKFECCSITCMEEVSVQSQNDEKDVKVEYRPCRVCGRTFQPSSLARHESICEKSRKSIQRKKFNSFLQRTKDIIPFPESIEKDNSKKPKRRWREQHEQLIKTVRCENGSPSHDRSEFGCRPTQKVIPFGYIQCPVCRRCFNHKAADRHIEWCQEQVSRLPKSPPSTEALQRLRARTQYRAPLPGKKRNASLDAQRLIKSADSCKGQPVVHRTYSSPGLLSSRTKHVAFQEPDIAILRRRSCERPSNEKYFNGKDKYYTLPARTSRLENSSHIPVVRFKDQYLSCDSSGRESFCNESDNDNEDDDEYVDDFDEEDDDSNQNYDILSALRLQLSELRASDDHDDDEESILDNADCFGKTSLCNFPSLPGSKQSPSKCDNNTRNPPGSSGSDSSGTLATRKDTEPRMPRFCYQCGTKYPVPSAKYCCECGSKRLVLGQNDNVNPVS